MDKHLGNHRTINGFVKGKIKTLNGLEANMASLYGLMFSQADNVLFEESVGYKIKKTTYGEALSSIEAIALALRERLKEAPHNALVALYMDNGHLWIEAFWAILRAGFCPLLLNMRLPLEILEETLRENNAVLVISDGASFQNAPSISLEELGKGQGKLVDVEMGELIHLMSSGTSQEVKVVSYDAKSLLSQLKNSYRIMRKSRLIKKHYRGELKLLAFLPFYHIFGLIAVYFWFGFFGRTFVKLNDFSPDTILTTIRRHKVTHIFAVPLLWETVYQKALTTIKSRGAKTYGKYLKGRKLTKIPLLGALVRKYGFRQIRDNLFGESISFMISGGGTVSKEALSFFNDIGYHLANGYGTSEIGIASVELSRKGKIRNKGSVGKPFASLSYKIDEECNLLVKGDSVAKYIRKNNETLPLEGYFNTHDMAKIDQGGRYYVLGREDELIVLPNGEKLNPNVYEPLLNLEGTHGCVLLDLGEGKTALVYSLLPYLSGAKTKLIEEEAKTRLKELNLEGKVGTIAFTNEPLIKGNEFKLNRGRLKKDYLSSNLKLVSLEEKDDVGYIDALEGRVCALFAEALGKKAGEVNANSDFFLNLGGSSLEYYALLSLLENEFGVSISAEGSAPLSTPHQIAEKLRSLI